MRKNDCAAFVAIGLSLFAMSACEPTRFESKDFNDPAVVQKEADTYWKRDGWWGGMPRTVTKVAITQFAVEYVTENVSKTSASALSVLGALEMAGMGHRKREFPESFKTEFPGRIYQEFVNALKASGVDVVTVDELNRHPSFATMKAAAGNTSFKANDRNFLGHQDANHSSKVEVYPLHGLPLLDNGWFGLDAANNARVEYKLIGDTGAQAGLHVRMRVALDDDGHAVIGGGSTIEVIYDLKKQQWNPSQPADWVASQRGIVVGGPALRDEVPVINSKEFKAFKGDVYAVDPVRFEQSILKMYPAYARMAIVKLRS